MEIIGILLIAAAVFGVCFLVDKGFTKLFRSQSQHKSGNSLRLNKRYGSIGLIVVVLGTAAIFTGLSTGWSMIVLGSILAVLGIALVVYYMSFGIFYDVDSFIYMTLFGGSKTYAYGDIQTQQLFNNGGTIMVELYMKDSTTVQVQFSMDGAYTFMDVAFAGWLQQTGRQQEQCAFYDPQNSCWFPPNEVL